MKTPKMRIEVFPSSSRADAKWKWHVVARNGTVVAVSPEGADTSKASAKRAAVRMHDTMGGIYPIWEVDAAGETVEVVREGVAENVVPISSASAPVAATGEEAPRASMSLSHLHPPGWTPPPNWAPSKTGAPMFPIPQREADDTRDDGPQK